MSAWRIERMTGGSGTIKHPYIVIDPSCPPGRHPTRDCGCRTFRTINDARSYAHWHPS